MLYRLFLTVIALSLPATDGLAKEPFKPKPINVESYAESFTSIVDLSDGTYVLLQLLITNAGIGDQKAACRALLVRPGSKAINSAHRVSRDDWSYSKQDGALYVDKCSLSSLGKKTDFVVKTDELQVYLTIEQAPSIQKTPGHYIKSGKDFLESEVLIPFAKASASLMLGGRSIKRSGWAYLDHARSTALLPDVAARWFRFRGFYGGEPVLVQLRYPPKGGKPVGWIWEKGSAHPSKLASASITRKTVKSKNIIGFKHRSKSFEITTGEMIFEYKPVEEYGFLGTLAKPWVGNPVNTSFRAVMLSDGLKLKGTLEYQELNP